MEQQLLSGISERNQLYCGDCLSALDIIPDAPIDLIYIDPPFYSQRLYEMIWGEDAAERFAFEDRWAGGINHYVNYHITRIKKMHAKLKDTGSFYIHLDWHISHYMKVELDKLFGYNNFQNEVIWQRHSGAHSDSKRFGIITDTLLFYSKGETKTFHPQYTPYTQEYIDYKYKSVEPGSGRRYWLNTATAAGPGKPKHFKGKLLTPPRGTHWRFSQENIDKLVKEGRIVFSDSGMPYVKYYLDELPGRPVQNLWDDIPMTKSGQERLGYPTQKPLALLERIINSSSNPGDLVMDAYCGCGTTLAAAQKLGRRWIGIDISQSAIRVVEQRLRKLGAVSYEVHGLVKSLKDLKALNPFEFQNWAINAVYGQHSPRKIADMGIDGFTFMEHHPIQVKQMDHVGRPVIDNFAGVLQREKEKKGMVIAFGFTSGTIDEVARLEREDKIKMELVKCADLVAGNVPYKIMI